MLSIVIPAKNEEKYIGKLLESIKVQKLDDCDLEVIVADAKSTDKTREIAKSYNKFYPCRIVNGGMPAVGRNNGAEKAEGNTLFFVDSDAILPENFIQSALEEFKKRKLDAAGTLQRPIPTKSFLRNIQYGISYDIANWWMRGFQEIKPYMQVGMFFKKGIFKKIGGFDPRLEFAEDSEAAIRAVKAGGKFGILTEPGKILVSTRRFDKGSFSLTAKYIYYNLARLLGKEFRNETEASGEYWLK